MMGKSVMAIDQALPEIADSVHRNGTTGSNGSLRASDLLAPRKSLGTLLVEMNLISAEALESVPTTEELSDMKLGDTLVEQGLITREDLEWL